MAFPAAHFSLGLGVATALGQKFTNYRWTLFWGLVSIFPDFDFFFVFVLGFSRRQYHRTFSHSIAFCLAASVVIFLATRRGACNPDHERAKPDYTRYWLAIFLVLVSHVALDFFCVSNYYRDGEMIFWPFDRQAYGYQSFLVSLYRRFGGEPRDYLKVAIPYTLLEIALWSPVTFWVLWKQKSRPAEVRSCQ